MTTRRQLIQSIPALPLMTTAGATALLVACGEKKQAGSTSSAPVSASPTPTPSPAPAVSTDAATSTGAAAPVANSGNAGSSGNSGSTGNASSGPLLDEKDPQAVALGYVAVAAKADKVKFPKYADGQFCSNCSLYLGGAAEQGGCPLFPGKQVLGKAWCSAWVKKVA